MLQITSLMNVNIPEKCKEILNSLDNNIIDQEENTIDNIHGTRDEIAMINIEIMET